MSDGSHPPAVTELGISYTLRCTSACRHCSVEASPSRHEKLVPSDIIPLVPELHEKGVRRVLFTGGEPALHIDELAQITQVTHRYDWRVALFSNGFWADSEENADCWSASFRRAGIHRVFLSTSRYHREFVDFDYLLRAIAALGSKGISAHVCCHLDATRNTGDLLVAQELHDRNASCSRFALCPEGRARALLPTLAPLRIPSACALTRPCSLQNQLFVNHTGRLLRCCAVSERLSRLETTEFYDMGATRVEGISDPLRRMSVWDPVYAILAHEGPGGVLTAVAEELDGSGFVLRDYYYSPCDLCTDLLGNPRVLHAIRARLSVSALQAAASGRLPQDPPAALVTASKPHEP
ncbi:MAG: radical SAM protein [Thermoanaerobaculaceae bacterium]